MASSGSSVLDLPYALVFNVKHGVCVDTRLCDTQGSYEIYFCLKVRSIYGAPRPDYFMGCQW